MSFFYIFAYMREVADNKGVKYETVEPKKGDIVRINIFRSYGDSSPLRDYFLIIWPGWENYKPYNYRSYGELFCYGTDLAGNFGKYHLCFSKGSDFVVKPKICDMYDISNAMKRSGYKYNLKTKNLIYKRNSYASNRQESVFLG